jgi:hypothetical protein
LGGAAVSGGWVFYGNDGGYLHGLANWTRYDFDVGSGEDKWAYEGEVSGTPATANDPDGVIDSYSNIRVDDGTYETYVTQNNNKYAAQRFNFSIDDNEESWITKINVTWNGKGWHDLDQYNGTYLYIRNFTSAAYEQLNSTTDGIEVTLTGGIVVTTPSDYVNLNNVTILVKQKSKQTRRTGASHIETDYVKLVVTP